jgi:hypothetical protein
MNCALPDLIAGPVLRHASTSQLVIWLVTSKSADLHWQLFSDDKSAQPTEHGIFKAGHTGCIKLGERAFLHCLTIEPDKALPTDCWIGYDIGIAADPDITWLRDTADDLNYPGRSRPEFVIKSRVDQVLHGSCRKPHFDGTDALQKLDELLATARTEGAHAQPAMLLCTGDQVYTDDVAGPYLSAIVQTIQLLGLYREALPGSGQQTIDSKQLLNDPAYYHRSTLLPGEETAGARNILFHGVRKPIFTSVNAENHLMTLGEVIAQYLLCWSPVLWQSIDVDTPPAGLSTKHHTLYQKQIALIRRFSSTLPSVRRALAHVPVYMIFDDHDVTDDWNLSRAWEESAYGHPLARRIIGNALIGYFLFQGWGNAPGNFDKNFLADVHAVFDNGSPADHDQLIGRLLKFEHWHFVIDCKPRVVVLDTRTQRWHSDTIASWPSGLMDWESLVEVQQHLLGQPAVILVSPAPIFGVKLIEIIQRIFTWLSFSLTVDAENWMAHPGSANGILNIFRHRKTPQNFVILSGDVHYAYACDVLLRHVKNSPHIWQITSSGFCNAFPPRLLRLFDRINRWLFASRSPLNWLTRRRRMRIRQRRPGQYTDRYRHQRLVNGCGIGRVCFDPQGRPVRIEQLLATGDTVGFTAGYDSDWVH